MMRVTEDATAQHSSTPHFWLKSSHTLGCSMIYPRIDAPACCTSECLHVRLQHHTSLAHKARQGIQAGEARATACTRARPRGRTRAVVHHSRATRQLCALHGEPAQAETRGRVLARAKRQPGLQAHADPARVGRLAPADMRRGS